MINASQEEALFDAARLLTSKAAQQAFLDQACADDSELRRRVEALLDSERDAESFFKNASAGMTPPPGEPAGEKNKAGSEAGAAEFPFTDGLGTRIGRYKLLQIIGEGGGGVVYMAEQEEPVRRRVALKIIKLGMDTKSVIARFEAERQALAMMDHPNIARVLDAGATETGRPYFVMELVRGVKITEYCDEHHLDTRQRLDLFIQICHAIQHAHQKGIIHRDIKPSNILVTLHDGVPVPKVIDFGIAKATETPLTDKTLFTAFGQFIGTPAYMSPEQAEMSGLDIDTRSDIYSLGVLLYELLTGKTPFDARTLMQAGLDEMRRTLREQEPQRPSSLLTTMQGAELTTTAAQRHTEPPKLVSQLKGDLDWIVMRALEKDRTRRYETANGLGMDVHRYLQNEPVNARPPSRLYRLQKLVRRNRGVFIGVSVAALALIVGFGTSTWLLILERQARRQAVQAEHEQSLLREVAERGRAKENELRLQAEMREKLTQAAFLLDQNQPEKADQIIASAQLPQKMLEGAAIYRSLGDWNALHHRWAQAADRFEILLRVGQFESGDISTLDYTRCSCTLMQIDSPERYEAFRTAAARRFAGTTDPISAERIVKVSLLAPASPDLLKALEPLAQRAIESFPQNNTNALDPGDWIMPWRCVSLALWEYRLGHWTDSVRWIDKCLTAGTGNRSRTATARVILAMDYEHLQREGEAQSALSQGRALIDQKFRSGLDMGDGGQGFWFDWALARVLAREATVLIYGAPAPQDNPELNPEAR